MEAVAVGEMLKGELAFQEEEEESLVAGEEDLKEEGEGEELKAEEAGQREEVGDSKEEVVVVM